MNHKNETDGVASHNFCFKYLSVNCTFRPSDWWSAVGNLRFFDPQLRLFVGINEGLFWKREKLRSFKFF